MFVTLKRTIAYVYIPKSGGGPQETLMVLELNVDTCRLVGDGNVAPPREQDRKIKVTIKGQTCQFTPILGYSYLSHYL